jgi:hypothetical protein
MEPLAQPTETVHTAGTSRTRGGVNRWQCVECENGALMEEIGARPPWFARISMKTLATIHTELDETAFAKAWEQGMTMTADEAVALALDSLAEGGVRPDGRRSPAGQK